MLTEMLSRATVYVVTGYTDMRKGIDGLVQIVEGSVGKDVYSKAVYLFCGRSNTKIKVLVWDENGFLLLYKKLYNGHYHWQRNWLFSNSPTGASTSTMLYSLVVSAK